VKLSKLWAYDDSGENYPYELKLPGGYSLAVGWYMWRRWYWRVIDANGMPTGVGVEGDWRKLTCHTAARAAAETFALGMGVTLE